MSRKMRSNRSAASRRASPPRHWRVNDAPRVEKPLRLICGACGASGRYHVGTLTLDPTAAKSTHDNNIEDVVGFTGYVRCRACDAGGPWKFPKQTEMYVTAMAIVAFSEAEDVPLIIGCTATFDKHTFRYATEGEAHLKGLIEREPERAFLWVRLGNLYSHCDENEHAQAAYERAIELNPQDIEAHAMLGQVLMARDRPLEAVPHWHAVLKHVRDARLVRKELRRELLRGAIECLLEAHARSNGQIELLPAMDPDEMEPRSDDEPIVLELREFDLGSEAGVNDLCDMFLEPPRRRARALYRRLKKQASRAPDDWLAAPVRRAALVVGRNERCSCGSGKKYKNCCGSQKGEGKRHSGFLR